MEHEFKVRLWRANKRWNWELRSTDEDIAHGVAHTPEQALKCLYEQMMVEAEEQGIPF